MGLTSRRITVIGMKKESEFVDAYQDFVRKRGIPHTLRRDNAKSETSEKDLNLQRDFVIADEYTEPYSPWQNPAEGEGVRFLKAHAEVLLNRSGCSDSLWFLCHEYICAVHECCANEHLNWETPIQKSGEERLIFLILCSLYGMNLFFTTIQTLFTQKPRRSQDTLLVLGKTLEMH